jgi:peptide-methionine (S)-S-oxide reductase
MKTLFLTALISISVLALTFFALRAPLLANDGSLLEKGADLQSQKPSEDYPEIILGGGCFWCMESEYRALNGVLFSRAGYMGGNIDNPTYQQVTTGKTGHAEVIGITYDPEKISYRELVDFFLRRAHDPTQLNRQGVDVGTQYRSAIFYGNEEEKKIAQETIAKINAEKLYDKPIVTEVSTASTFWIAEEYHQQYYEKYAKEKGQDHIRVLLKKMKK